MLFSIQAWECDQPVTVRPWKGSQNTVTIRWSHLVIRNTCKHNGLKGIQGPAWTLALVTMHVLFFFKNPTETLQY